MGDLTKNFSRSEFACTCGCGRSPMDANFIEKLQQWRTRYGKLTNILSGYRCPHHPIWSAHSAHSEGKAADLGIPREDYHTALRLAFELGFSGIFLKNKDGQHQLHLDTAEAIIGIRPRPWVGTY